MRFIISIFIVCLMVICNIPIWQNEASSHHELLLHEQPTAVSLPCKTGEYIITRALQMEIVGCSRLESLFYERPSVWMGDGSDHYAPFPEGFTAAYFLSEVASDSYASAFVRYHCKRPRVLWLKYDAGKCFCWEDLRKGILFAGKRFAFPLYAEIIPRDTGAGYEVKVPAVSLIPRYGELFGHGWYIRGQSFFFPSLNQNPPM